MNRTSDVRIVNVYADRTGSTKWKLRDDPSGTHLLVPVDRLKQTFTDGEGTVLSFGVLSCPTCGGSGDVSDGTLQTRVTIGGVTCPDCNGRGWRLSDE